MKIAHVLLVHKNPQQIVRLIKRLSHPDIDCWVHIDKKFDTPEFRKVLSSENIFYVTPNINVGWGCYNTVEAMLLGMQNIIAAKENYDYITFLSGQDYVLQPPAAFLNYLKANNGLEFIGIQPYEVSIHNIIRLKKYHFNDYSFFGKNLLETFINKITPERKFPYPYEVRKGPQWLTITKNAAIYIADFVANNPRYVNYFRKVHIPDEFFFQTILFNSAFKHKIKDGVFHYTDWSENKAHPRLLTINDKQNILASDYFFSRKFDATVDATILDLIDKEKLAFV
jgi:Core-2/I-Branching enzyme